MVECILRPGTGPLSARQQHLTMQLLCVEGRVAPQRAVALWQHQRLLCKPPCVTQLPRFPLHNSTAPSHLQTGASLPGTSAAPPLRQNEGRAWLGMHSEQQQLAACRRHKQLQAACLGPQPSDQHTIHAQPGKGPYLRSPLWHLRTSPGPYPRCQNTSQPTRGVHITTDG